MLIRCDVFIYIIQRTNVYIVKSGILIGYVGIIYLELVNVGTHVNISTKLYKT